jgi:hypothetical protein
MRYTIVGIDTEDKLRKVNLYMKGQLKKVPVEVTIDLNEGFKKRADKGIFKDGNRILFEDWEKIFC